MGDKTPVRPIRRKRSKMDQSTWTDPQLLEDSEEVGLFRAQLEEVLGPWDEPGESGSVEEAVSVELNKLEKSIPAKSFEDELKFRYRRMLLVAASLKKMYANEMLHHREWVRKGADAREGYVQVALNMLRKCQETSLGWKKLLAEKVNDFEALKEAYDDMVNRAAVALEMNALKLIEAEQRFDELEQEAKKRVETMEVSTCTTDLFGESQRADTAEMAAKNFEILFDIATNKLGAYEQEETKLRSAWKSMDQPKSSFKSYTLPRGGAATLQLHSDDVSVASVDTTDSASLKTERSPAQEITPISTSLRSLLQKSSPKPRKKKKSPFRHFMKRSVSQESQIQNLGSSFDQLPPISDCPPLEIEHLHRDIPIETANKCSSNQSAPMGPASSKSESKQSNSKVQRTMSFADGKSSAKSGLVALAKDIEKRFKRKRRSKTADFSGLSHQMKEVTEPSDFGCDNVLCSESEINLDSPLK